MDGVLRELKDKHIPYKERTQWLERYKNWYPKSVARASSFRLSMYIKLYATKNFVFDPSHVCGFKDIYEYMDSKCNKCDNILYSNNCIGDCRTEELYEECDWCGVAYPNWDMRGVGEVDLCRDCFKIHLKEK